MAVCFSNRQSTTSLRLFHSSLAPRLRPRRDPRPRNRAASPVCRHRSRQARGLDRRDGRHGRCAIYLQNARISPDAAFSLLARTAYVVVMAAIGGIGTMEGAIRRRCDLLFDAALSCQYFGAWYL